MSLTKKIKGFVLSLLFPRAEDGSCFYTADAKALRSIAAPPSDECLAPYYYIEPASGIVKALKFQGERQLAPLMARDIRPLLAAARFDVITAVPLHRRRLAERGFNQSELIARELGGEYRELLLRIRDTPHQSTLSPEARARNLDGAFVLRSGADIKDKTVLLVDDVYTTGNTMRATERVLLEAGASRVIFAAYARTRFERPPEVIL